MSRLLGLLRTLLRLLRQEGVWSRTVLVSKNAAPLPEPLSVYLKVDIVHISMESNNPHCASPPWLFRVSSGHGSVEASHLTSRRGIE